MSNNIQVCSRSNKPNWRQTYFSAALYDW